MKYAVIDLGGDMNADELLAYASAQERQLCEHYASCYDGDGIDDTVRVVTPAQPFVPTGDECPIYFHKVTPANAPDGALAVHGVGPNGLPTCDVYRDLIEQANDNPWSAASHEVLESRTDPRLHACVELDDGTIWDRECCDRVESDSYSFPDGPGAGVPLSNFNTPACFEPTGAPGEFYDWMRLSTKPNEVRPGGYAQQFTLGQGWTQVGEKSAYRTELDRRGLSRGARRKARKA